MSAEGVYLWMILATLALLGVCVLAASAARRRRDMLLATTGRRAIGRVVDSGFDSDGMGIRTHWVKVEYGYDGELITAKVAVSEDEQRRYRIGQRVGLTYAPSRSKVVKLDPPQWALH